VLVTTPSTPNGTLFELRDIEHRPVHSLDQPAREPGVPTDSQQAAGGESSLNFLGSLLMPRPAGEWDR